MNLAISTLPADYQPRIDLLKDRVALVTGAGQGLGKVAALAFAQHGATVILHGRNVPKLETVMMKSSPLASRSRPSCQWII